MTTPEPRTGERDERRVRDAELHQRLWPEQVVEWRGIVYSRSSGGFPYACPTCSEEEPHPWHQVTEPCTKARPIPHYHEDGNAMLAVIARMRELGWPCRLEFGDRGWARAWYVGSAADPVHAPTAPEAVCAAALAALAAREGGA